MNDIEPPITSHRSCLGEGIRLYDNPGSEPIRVHRVGEATLWRP